MNLVCMLDTDEDPILIQHFLAYYRALGVDNFLFALHSLSAENVAINKTKQLLQEEGCNVGKVIVGPMNFYRLQPVVENGLRQRYLEKQDWCIIADIDEFVEIDRDFLKSLDSKTQFDYVEGFLVDCLGKEGDLTPIRADQDIFTQFPVRSFLTRDICNGCISKIPLAKTWVSVGVGHHGVIGSDHNRFSDLVSVSHFKWSDRVIEKIHARLCVEKLDQADVAEEMRRFLTFYNKCGGRIDLKKLKYLEGRRSQGDNFPILQP